MRLIHLGPCSAALVLCACLAKTAQAGPYSSASNDPSNPYDAPIAGFIGPHGEGKARLFTGEYDEISGLEIYENPNNFVNPLFYGWADGWASYARSDSDTAFSDPSLALGPVTGDDWDVVSLGDLTATQLSSGSQPGRLVVTFSKPISDKPGADFAVFENALVAAWNLGGAGIGGIFAELAHVEVSSDGVHFVRFPSISQTTASIGAYGSLDVSNVFHLAGKHLNGAGESWGTPFDLSQLANHPQVLDNTVDLTNITTIRFVDVPGNGTIKDSLNQAIYDPWRTFGSAGFDLEAVGAIAVPITYAEWESHHNLSSAQSGALEDPDGDHCPNILEAALGRLPLSAEPSPPSVCQLESGVPGISFTRDTRMKNLVITVFSSTNLENWVAVAESIAGGPLLPIAPHSPVMSDVSASSHSAIGVIRRHHVSFGPATGPRFFKLEVSEITP